VTDNLDDVGPVTGYDPPDTAAMVAETGSRELGRLALDFPASLAGVPADAPAAARLEATRRLIGQTLQAMRTLPFAGRLSR